MATPNRCYLAAFNGVGNGDFSQSLVRHKALTSEMSEPVSWSASVTNDAGNDVGLKLCVIKTGN